MNESIENKLESAFRLMSQESKGLLVFCLILDYYTFHNASIQVFGVIQTLHLQNCTYQKK